MKWILVVLIFTAEIARAEVVTRIIDTGAGLATVTRFPDGSILVYDTGNWISEKLVVKEFEKFIGKDDIDLLILSHTDADHIGATVELLKRHRVRTILRTRGKARFGRQ